MIAIAIVPPFKEYLYQLGYSESTQKMLPACVAEFLTQQRITSLSGIESAQVQAFYDWLQTRPLKRRPGALSAMMIQHYVYALKTFFSWLETTGQIDYNPISGLKFKRSRPNTRTPLSTTDISALFAAAGSLQDTALLHLFYSCGLRRSEGEALTIQDIYFKQQLLYVRAGKGARRRVIPLTATVAAQLEAYYIQERRGYTAATGKDSTAFMLNRRGHRLSGEGCNGLLKELVNKAGLDKDISLHHLRHSIATHLLQSGMGMEYVKDFLGHRFLESTQVYAKTTPEQLKKL